MKVLITGASGFIGSNLIPYLRKHIQEIVWLTLGRNNADITWDQLENTPLSGTDVIIHLAGKAHDTKNTSQSEEYFQVNYELTRYLFDKAIKEGVNKFIYVSSVKAAADTVAGLLTEDMLPDPKTAYGQSKLKAEQYISDRAAISGISSYILRPCMVHGPGNKGNLNLLYQFARRGIPYPLAAFHNQRSFLSIENFCFVVRELISRPIAPGIYNIADDEALSTTELIRIIAAVTGKKAALWAVPEKAVRFAARTGDVIKTPLNSERLKKLTESYHVDNTRIKRALGIEHMPVAAKQGLEHTIRSFIHTP